MIYPRRWRVMRYAPNRVIRRWRLRRHLRAAYRRMHEDIATW